ncbi:hypothetical protein SAMN05421810_104374 [Amycolatopsis arida]|uniref:Excreted virulence factor EspC, type VII ESX diderm n=1 Tax=Amycolatopsis arida TaxID=587909 RepID=A0A1I5VHH4_9PSEU|nr:hypothetical protein [Amycolatopsis arida]TDX87887.1 hypothetical protein CLV69_11219 [Amycolatopsis arida]SFQ06929.1 hypothetical protein SAMN05421810_104374 [Amycolatopsis arida]
MTDVGRTGPDAAPGTAGFAVAPELAVETFRRLSELQDVVGAMVRQAKVLGRSVPLGGGYAAEVGDFMARYGLEGPGSAVAALTRFGRELEELKDRIDTAVRRYRDADEDAAGGVDCTGG